MLDESFNPSYGATGLASMLTTMFSKSCTNPVRTKFTRFSSRNGFPAETNSTHKVLIFRKNSTADMELFLVVRSCNYRNLVLAMTITVINTAFQALTIVQRSLDNREPTVIGIVLTT